MPDNAEVCFEFKLFGTGLEPDAVNFWFGDGRAVTSCEFSSL